MNDVVQSGSDAGRLGHGLGTQLTEWPSIIPDDHTEMLEGMVMTLEPGIEVLDGRIMVHGRKHRDYKQWRSLAFKARSTLSLIHI